MSDEVIIRNIYHCVANPVDTITIDRTEKRVRIVAMSSGNYTSVYMSIEDAESLMLSIAVILKQIREEQEGRGHE